MFKKILIVLGALLILTSVSLGQPVDDEFTVTAKCASSHEFLDILRNDNQVPMASMEHIDLGGMIFSVSPKSGNWFLLYFKGKDVVCSVMGGTGFKLNNLPEPSDQK
jgi:hypothetical protein